jgi:hypothetical protein
VNKNISEVNVKILKMFLKISSSKVQAIKKFFSAILILTLVVFNGNIHCSDSNNEGGSQHIQPQHNSRRSVSGSGSGQLDKQRSSSYAVISQAFSDTVNNEFGSKFLSVFEP